MIFSLLVVSSIAFTVTIPSASTSKTTSIFGVPLLIGGMLSNLNSPK
jgi:hypothetical protein